MFLNILKQVFSFQVTMVFANPDVKKYRWNHELFLFHIWKKLMDEYIWFIYIFLLVPTSQILLLNLQMHSWVYYYYIFYYYLYNLFAYQHWPRVSYFPPQHVRILLNNTAEQRHILYSSHSTLLATCIIPPLLQVHWLHHNKALFPGVSNVR